MGAAAVRILGLGAGALLLSGCATGGSPNRPMSPASHGALPNVVAGAPKAAGTSLVPESRRRQYFDERKKRYYFFDPVLKRYFWEDGRPWR